MRARNIKPAFYKSDQISECSIFARYIFPGLWMLADRKGRLEYRPKRIKAELLPYDNIEIEPLLKDLETNGLIKIYETNNKKYIWIPTFCKHQSPHNNEVASVLPPHPEDNENEKLSTKDESVSNQGKKSLQPKKKPLHPELIDPELINTESLIKEFSSEQQDCSEQTELLQAEVLEKPPCKIFIKFPLNDGNEFEVTFDYLKKWEEFFPAVDIQQEFRKMGAWLYAHSKNRKTKRGINQFIQRWLSSAQDNPKSNRNFSYPVKTNISVNKTQQVIDDQSRIMREILEEDLQTQGENYGSGNK